MWAPRGADRRAGDGRRTGDRQYLYVNGRPVDFAKLGRLLNDAFRQATAKAECFPVAVLDVRAPPTEPKAVPHAPFGRARVQHLACPARVAACL